VVVVGGRKGMCSRRMTRAHHHVSFVCRYYSFGLFAERLKENGQFTQGEIATVGYMLDLGVFGFRPIVGMLFDNFGVRPSFAACSVIGGTGYLMVSMAVRAHPHSSLNSVGFLSVAFVLVGVAGSLG
jgi:hypothetical protein